MRRALLLHIFVIAALAVTSLSDPPPAADYFEGQVIVKLKPHARSVMGPAAVAPSLHPRVIARTRIIGAELWQIEGMTVEEACERFADHPDIDYITPNYRLTLDATLPNDPRLPEMWGLYNRGEISGVFDADIDATEAWDIETGEEVLVGMVDTGVDYNHEDLAANIFINPNEIPDNNIDDDNNGYVDDWHGWDFVDGDNDPMDDHGHGTHTSGTVAAVGNNGIGVVGVCWTAKILPLKIFDAAGNGGYFEGAQALEYAVMMGARVTSNSWSAGGFIARDVLTETIDLARSAGQIVVTSAGNSRLNVDLAPASPQALPHDNIIAVANTTRDDRRNVWSSFGPTTIDLGAPGTSVLSTTLDNTYSFFTGTSMSTPHVTGAVALIWSAAPNMPYQDVIDLILSTVDPLPELAGITVSGGRLNVRRALEVLDTTGPEAVSTLAASALGNQVTLQWNATGDDGIDGTARRYDIRYASAPIDDANFDAADPVAYPPAPGAPGTNEEVIVEGLRHSLTYYFRMRVVDETGNASALSNQVTATTDAAVPAADITVTPGLLSKTMITGGTAQKTLTIHNNGSEDFEWRARIDDFAFVPGMKLGEPVEGDIPGYPDPALLNGVRVVFDLSHGQVQDRWQTVIDDLESRGAQVTMNESAVTSNLLGQTDILWITDTHVWKPWSGSELEALRRWTWRGGGLLLEGDDEPSITVFNDILTALGAGIELEGTPGTPGITYQVFPNPVSQKLAAVILEQNQAHIARTRAPASTMISDKAGTPAAGWSIVGSGHVVVFADELLEDSRIDRSRVAAEDNRLLSWQTFAWLSRSQWIRLSRRTGSVPPGGSQDVTVTFDAAALAGGFYNANLTLASTQPTGGFVGVPAQLGVAAAPDIEISQDQIDFGTVYVGYPIQRSVTVYNGGSEDLIVRSVATDDPDFTADVDIFLLPTGEIREMVIECDPSTAGALSSTLTMTTFDPDEPLVTIGLNAERLYPPAMDVNPTAFDAVLLSDEIVTQTVTISNTGQSDLVVTAYTEFPEGTTATNRSVTSGDADVDVTNFAEFATDAPALDPPLPESESRVNAESGTFFSDDFEDGNWDGWNSRGNGTHTVTDEVTANFTQYSFYESNAPAGHANGVDRILIDEKPSYISVHIRPSSTEQGDGYFVLRDESGALILYTLFSSSGYLGINSGQPGQDVSILYEANRWYWFEFKNVDFEKKRFDYYLDKKLIRANMPFGSRATGGGIAKIELYCFVTGGASWWDEIIFSSGDTWLRLDPPTATVPAGESRDLGLIMDGTSLASGEQALDLVVGSNDPASPVFRIPVNVDVQAVPNVRPRGFPVDFGDVIEGVAAEAGFDIVNVGFEEDVVVNSFTSVPPYVTTTPPSPTLGPRDERPLKVIFLSSEVGPVNGDIIINSNDRDEPALHVPYTANVLRAPQLSVSPDSIEETLNAGDRFVLPLIVSNTGGVDAADLEYDAALLPYVGWGILSPRVGVVPPGQADTIGLDLNATSLFAGEYTTSIRFLHNIPGEPTLTLPVTLNVVGTPNAEVNDTLDFGIVFNGFSTDIPLVFANIGTDSLRVTSVVIDHPDISVSPEAFSVAPAKERTITVTVLPTMTGTLDATLSFSTNDPDDSTVVVTVVGEVLEAPAISLSRDSVTVTLISDDEVDEILTVYNAGQSPLEWSIDIGFAEGGTAAAASGTTASASARAVVSSSSLIDVLWHGEHGFGFSFWSSMISDIEGIGGTVTQSNDEVTAELLSGYDILWLGNLAEALSSSEKNAIAAWLPAGGSLFIEADSDLAIAEYNPILTAVGANILLNGADAARSDLIHYPHELTFGVQLLASFVPQARVITSGPPAGVFMADIGSVPIGAYSTVGNGRIVVISDQFFNDVGIESRDNRILGTHVFEWLAGVRWVSPAPLSGATVPDDSTEVTLSFNAAQFGGGSYAVWLELTTNDPSANTIRVPVTMVVSGVEAVLADDNTPPLRDALYQNVPNPFNPTTRIRYDVASAQHVTLTIYDVAGRVVRRVVDATKPAGRYTAVWDGRNDAGTPVATGIYFYKLQAGSFIDTRKMVLLK